MIARRHRLSGKDIFYIFKKPNKNIYKSLDYMNLLYSTQNQTELKRFTIVVSRKIGKVYIRHIIKRKLYAVIHDTVLKSDTGINGDYVVIIKTDPKPEIEFAELSYDHWKKLFVSTWNKMQRKLSRRSDEFKYTAEK